MDTKQLGLNLSSLNEMKNSNLVTIIEKSEKAQELPYEKAYFKKIMKPLLASDSSRDFMVTAKDWMVDQLGNISNNPYQQNEWTKHDSVVQETLDKLT